jgi:hypothetical protein
MRKQPIPLDEYGFRIGSLKSRAAVMYAQGATFKQVLAALGSPQLRLLQELEVKGFAVTKEKIATGVKGERRQTKYTLRKP